MIVAFPLNTLYMTVNVRQASLSHVCVFVNKLHDLNTHYVS